MTIACIGWGSLIWDPRELPMRRRWFEDGPLLTVEFARVSTDGRVTLVQVDAGPKVRCLWTLLDTDRLDVAREALRRREGIPESDAAEHVGYWSPDGPSNGAGVDAIERWATRLELDAAVWTALPPGMSDETRGEVPAVDDLLEHVRGLDRTARDRAEAYVRRAPPQIDTPYRRRFELELGWTPGGGSREGSAERA